MCRTGVYSLSVNEYHNEWTYVYSLSVNEYPTNHSSASRRGPRLTNTNEASLTNGQAFDG
jgi:hypothetical protein